MRMITPLPLEDFAADFSYAGGEVMSVQFGLKKNITSLNRNTSSPTAASAA